MPYANPADKQAYQRAYYVANQERLKRQFVEYHAKNPLAALARQRKRRAVNPEAVALANREWREKNPDKCLVLSRQHYKKNADKCNAATRAWRERNHQKYMDGRVAYRRVRKQRDPAFHMVDRLRKTLGQALKKQGARKVCRSIQLIGCTAPELAAHLESQFLPYMAWENRRLWHIDHKRPCASFDLTDPEQQKACFHYTNLQPLWAEDNQRKGARV